MAEFLAAKVPTEVVRREWVVPVDSDDAPGSVSLSASGVTVDDNAFEGNTLVLTLSAGSAATTGTITATVATEQGRTLVETLYIPVIASTAVTADTAQDYVAFALRKIVGIGEDASADELAHGLEILNGLIARMRAGGADIGAAYPLTSSTVIYCPEWAVSALRYNLLIECAPLFGVEPSALEYDLARRGLQLIKHKNLPDKRAVEFY